MALALLLGGLAAPLASAQTRQQAVAQANRFIDWCFASGGEPTPMGPGSSDVVGVYCKFGDGSTMVCIFYPDVSCHQYPPLVHPPKTLGDLLGGEGGVATSDPSAGAGSTNGPNGSLSAKAAAAGGNNQPAAHQHSHRHGAKPKPGKAAKHQQAHAGKK